MTHLSTRKGAFLAAVWFALIALAACSHPSGGDRSTRLQTVQAGGPWEEVGRLAAGFSSDRIIAKGGRPQQGAWVVMTNAGYAEVNESTTQAALDGLASITGASRGRNTLVEVHSAPWAPLWFALYDQASGWCSYLEVDGAAAAHLEASPSSVSGSLFKKNGIERIDAAHLFGQPTECAARFSAKPFGGNEFRIITIANAVAAGAPAYAVRSFEFHDHYCPGVTSGILLANYLKRHFPAGDGGYFIHAVTPWCKEDALLVMLNATPGKRSFAVDYPSEADTALRPDDTSKACTIAYRRDSKTEPWQAMVLGFRWAETGCPQTGNSLIDKLCADLWYLEHMQTPEDFVQVLRTFTLEDGVSPTDWARPGIDPMKELNRMK